MFGRMRWAWMALAAGVALPWAAARAQERPAPADARVMVLGNLSFWRMHHSLKPPVVDADGRAVPYLRNVAWLDEPTSPPPPAWREPNFDDSAWLRTMASGGCDTPYLARQCLRGKFLVTAASQVRDLRLSVEYHGGVVVYLNGKELTRQHLPAGTITEATLAEAYPLEAFVAPSGELLAIENTYLAQGRAGRPDAESVRRMASRDRRLENFPVPPGALRPGVNVLAIEVIRSAFHKVLLDGPDASRGRGRNNKYDWNTCQLLDVRLTSAGTGGLVPNAGRPAGLQVWNSDPLAADGAMDYGDTCEPLGPVRLAAARNGAFSGKVVVGSSKAISGLKATAGELIGPAGTVPASAVRVRYGHPFGEEAGFSRREATIRSPYPQGAKLYGAVVNSPPSEVAVEQTRNLPLSGAVLPVWVTVTVPKQTPPGNYAGQLRIEVAGDKPVLVPIHLEVAYYTLPDPQDNRTWVELIQVPDTPAVEYDVPLWSDRHMEMIAESFRLISPSGTRVVYLPAIAHTNLGNAESMIRWIRKGENRYEWDFSVMDRYLDLAQEHLGTPKVVVLQVWEIYMSTRESVGKRFGAELDDRQKASNGGCPLVTVVDRPGGTPQDAVLPRLDEPPSKAIWQGLIAQVRQRLRPRGLDKALMLGMFTDAVPPKEHIQFFHDIAPDLPWVQQGHGRWTQKVYGISEVGYQATVWGGFRFGDGLVQTNQRAPAAVQSLYGWKGPRLDAVFERNTGLDAYPSTRWLFFPETGITSELRGIGRIGADYWRSVKDRQGRRVGWPHNRFSEGGWSGSSISLNLCSSALAPGPGGPATTTRLLALNEGVQACEARIQIERALTDERLKARLGADLARQCQQTLDVRLHDMWRALSNHQLGGVFFFGAGAWRWTAGVPGHRWYLSTGWQDGSKQLFDLAGKVQRAVGS